MSALYILVGTSLVVALGFLIGFIWAMRKGQYDDDYTPSVRMLFDNTIHDNNFKENTSKENKSDKQQ